MKRNKEEVEASEMRVPLSIFVESYNQNIPVGFPRASVAILKNFQTAHPALFKHGDMWSVAQHRKRLIDWLSVQRNIS